MSKKKRLGFRENIMITHVIGRFAFSRKLSRIYLKSKDMHFFKNGLNLQAYISNDVIFHYHSYLS